MKIEVLQYSDSLDQTLVKDKVAVVVDVFRATSVIVTALHNGAKDVIPKVTIEEALKEAKSRGEDNYILGGERKMKKIKGFHLGNSPQEYTEEVVKDKSVILTTTNGTKAIDYCHLASEIYICSLLNAAYVAKKLAKIDRDVVVVCSGLSNQFSLEDAFCAGMLIEKMSQYVSIEIDDFGLLLGTVFKEHEKDFHGFLGRGQAYKNLSNHGFKKEIQFSLIADIYAVAPKLINNRISGDISYERESSSRFS